MGSLFILTVSVVLGAITVILSQQQPPARQCMQDFDKNLSSRCFENVGLNFQGVLFLITQNVTGSLPAGESVASYRQKVCPPQQIDSIVPCVLKFAFGFRNKSCSAQEMEMIGTSGRQLAGMLENMCTEPCARAAIQSAEQCFVSARVDPQQVLNTTMIRDKFTFIGLTQQASAQFCNARSQVFTCLKQVMQPCPAARKSLNEMGFDVLAMEKSAELLCNNQQAYTGAVQCFAQPSPQISACRNQTNQGLRQMLFFRYSSGEVKPSEFILRLCGLRLNQVDCELRAFRQTCAQTATLRNQLECTILPEPCRTNPLFRSGLAQLCPSGRPTGTTNVPANQQTPRPSGKPPSQNTNTNQPPNSGTGSASGSGSGSGSGTNGKDRLYSSSALLFVLAFTTRFL
ncbi:uncharacterized protein LOC121390641 [Gigantopelta aegis]|uniref:uncharacterized protein LOC121390641 n=1 Tax=Gigantopelta aegis TaxID=1735272 RepID=UPI001B88E3CF|nr:uncharacterized protein LOC121390641 [Gigantopelta aegis]